MLHSDYRTPDAWLNITGAEGLNWKRYQILRVQPLGVLNLKVYKKYLPDIGIIIHKYLRNYVCIIYMVSLAEVKNVESLKTY